MLLPSKEADEIKHNCVEEFYVNQLETEAKECAKSCILAKVEDFGHAHLYTHCRHLSVQDWDWRVAGADEA